MPLEQTRLQLFLKQPDLPAERRLSDAKSVGSFTKASKFGDMDQGTELGKIHNLSQSVISDHKQFVICDKSQGPNLDNHSARGFDVGSGGTAVKAEFKTTE
jgi:hypothetical protein